jgi:hypothetical protein
VLDAYLPHPLSSERQMEVWQKERGRHAGVAKGLRDKGFRISFYREFLVFRNDAFIGVANLVSVNRVPHQFHTMGQAIGFLQGAAFVRKHAPIQIRKTHGA